MTAGPHDLAPTRLLPSPEDYDADGRFLYPGDVEDAMPEGNLGLLLAVYLLETIRRLVVDPARASAYASLPIYYRKGDPGRHVSPDAFYLDGVPYERDLPSYCLWKTGVPPRVVFEVVSRGYERKDVDRNRRLYAELGVPEYYWFHPKTRQLTALRLDPDTGRYAPAHPEPSGRHASPALGLEVGVHQGEIRLFQDGVPVPPSDDLIRRLELARADADRARDEAERAYEAERSAHDEERRRREQAERAHEAERHAHEAERRRREEAERARDEAERAREVDRRARDEAERRLAELERQRRRDADDAP